MGKRADKAVELFHQGYNCSQSVFGAFCDLYGMELETALRVSSSFGGGMGRMREVCGAVSGMFMVIGMETGTVEGKDSKGKQYNYEMVQKYANEYKEMNGSIICRELLGLEKNNNTDTKPEERTSTYYKKRPCVELVRDAALLLEEQLLKDKLLELQVCEEVEPEIQQVEFIPVKSEEQIKKLAALADEVWHEYFVELLSLEQIDYMVERFQSEHAMTEQMKQEGYEYYLIKQGNLIVGYTGVKPEEKKLFLSKLYVMKAYRGKGYASKAFAFLTQLANERGWNAIYLTVNKYNEHSIEVYKAKGFEVVKSQVADIGEGYVMDDYVMEWQLS